MNKLLITVLIIISLVILNTKLKGDIQEGFTQCEYRKKQNTGTMCNEKWGEPECRTWTKNEKVKTIKDGPTLKVLKGYYSNDFMYELDYENYETQLIEGEEGKKEEGGEENIPRGIHSSFFA